MEFGKRKDDLAGTKATMWDSAFTRPTQERAGVNASDLRCFLRGQVKVCFDCLRGEWGVAVSVVPAPQQCALQRQCWDVMWFNHYLKSYTDSLAMSSYLIDCPDVTG